MRDITFEDIIPRNVIPQESHSEREFLVLCQQMAAETRSVYSKKDYPQGDWPYGNCDYVHRAEYREPYWMAQDVCGYPCKICGRCLTPFRYDFSYRYTFQPGVYMIGGWNLERNNNCWLYIGSSKRVFHRAHVMIDVCRRRGYDVDDVHIQFVDAQNYRAAERRLIVANRPLLNRQWNPLFREIGAYI